MTRYPSRRNILDTARLQLTPSEKTRLWRRYGAYLPAQHREVMRLWIDERLYQADIAVRLGLIHDRSEVAGGKYLPTQHLLDQAGLLLYGMSLLDTARKSDLDSAYPEDGASVVVDAD